MVRKIDLGFLMLLCGGALTLPACASSHPRHTGFYCIDIPTDSSTSAAQFVDALANKLKFEVSSAQYPAEVGPPHRIWEIYGGGVSMILDTAMKSGKPDSYGNRPVTFSDYRLGLNVVQTSLWQSIDFEQVLSSAKVTAERYGWSFSPGKGDVGCST